MTPKELALEDGFDDARATGIVWNDYKVFEPIFKDEKFRIIGLPHSILQNGKETRFTTDEECFDVFDLLYPNNSNEEEAD